jgi:hypothetical protein
MNHSKLKSLVQNIYSIVGELEEMFPGRHFTPDGHMIGSLGECLVADAYDLELKPASNKGYDAVAPSGRKVEIKATQAKSVAFRSCPEHTIIIKINPEGTFEEIYNGPGDLIWKQFEVRKLPTNGQYQIALSKVRKLAAEIQTTDQLPRVR